MLLVRHSYGSGTWMQPGGGLNASEDPAAAATRELAEETGLVLVGPKLHPPRSEDLHGAPHTVHDVVGTATGVPIADGRELIDARFFALDALPTGLANGIEGHLRAILGDGPPA